MKENASACRRFAALTALSVVPLQAGAHAVSAGDDWSADAWIVACMLLVAAALYAKGLGRLRLRGGRGLGNIHVAAFIAGWCALALALLSPLDAWGESLFSVHMVQHELVMLVAAPLLVAGKPLAVAAWAFRARRSSLFVMVIRAVRGNRIWRTMETPLAAWLLHLLVVWLWHAPRLFQASLASDWIHAIQHASFLFSALLFWWVLLRRRGNGLAVMYVLTTAIHTGVLGALLVFAPRPLYPAYLLTTQEWGLTALEDQQLGGLIMWVPAGLILLGMSMALFAQWLDDIQRRASGIRQRLGG